MVKLSLGHMKTLWGQMARMGVNWRASGVNAWSGNRFVIWNVNGVDDAGWKAAAGRQGCPSKGQLLCRAVPLRMLVGRYELLRLRQAGNAAE